MIFRIAMENDIGYVIQISKDNYGVLKDSLKASTELYYDDDDETDTTLLKKMREEEEKSSIRYKEYKKRKEEKDA